MGACAGIQTVIVKEISVIKKRIPALHWKCGKGTLQARPHPDTFLSCEREARGLVCLFFSLLESNHFNI